VSSQNGLDHYAHLAPFLPILDAGAPDEDDESLGERIEIGRYRTPRRRAPVVPALAYIAAERLSAGRVRFLAGDRIVVPASAEDAVRSVVGPGGLVVRGVADMKTASWQKLLGNLVANAITTLTTRRIPVMQEPGIEDLARGLLLEALQVGRAEGARLSDSDVESVLAGTGRYGADTGSSMLYDRLAGRPLEHQYLTGEVVRRGNAHGIPVPLNSAVLALLEAIDRGRDLP
jgi:2-dehydropantoate 2-reductase